MGYQIRMAAEVADWLARLIDSDPATAELVDQALAALREQGPGGWTPGTTRQSGAAGPAMSAIRVRRVNVEGWLMICG